MHEALRRGETVEAEYRLCGLDGRTRQVLDRMQPRPAPGGRTLVEGIVMELPAAEAAPEPDEALYTLLLAPDGSAVVESAGSGWTRVLGGDVGTRPDVVGDAWVAHVHPADTGAFLAAREELRAGRPIEAVYRLVGLDGQERVVVDRAAAHRRPDGGLIACGLLFEVTAERRARLELDEIRERLETVLAAVAEVVFTEQLLDDGQRCAVFLGPGVEGILGARVDRPDLAAAWDAAVHPDDRPAWSAHQAAIARGEAADVEHRLLGLDGRIRWVALRSRPRLDAAGRRLVDGIAADVTARREEADRAAERARRLRSLVDAIDDVVLTVELHPPDELRPVLFGAGLERLLGGAVPARTEPLSIWRAALHPDDRPAFAVALERLAALQPVDHVHRVAGLDGVVRWLEWRARPRATAEGHVLVEGLLSDVSAERSAIDAMQRAHEDAEQRSRADALTGLANRAYLDEALAGATGPFGLLALDVDHFKRVNDTYGHAVGDEVLVEVARRLVAVVRTGDLVARPGGEEFAVLLPQVRADDVLRRVAESVRRAIEQPPVATAAGPLAITASLGAARRSPGDERPGAAVADDADAALYAAKRRGRNRVVLAHELTEDDRVAEDPAPVRLARALALAAGCDVACRQRERSAARIAEELGLAPAESIAAQAASWLVGVDPAAVAAVRELAEIGPGIEAWRAGEEGADAPAVARVLGLLGMAQAA
jgi:diguanylate cyclase (GGDEF)-like protein